MVANRGGDMKLAATRLIHEILQQNRIAPATKTDKDIVKASANTLIRFTTRAQQLARRQIDTLERRYRLALVLV